jgi:hypothetical protein
VYQLEDARAFLATSGVDVDAVAPVVDGQVTSAFVRAKKPAVAAKTRCCGPACCA